jgi:hypothetical protein
MKNFKITESERNSILRKYNLINEQSGGNKTICDIQRAVGSSVDNVFGDQTYNAVMSILNRKFADPRENNKKSGYEPDIYER